MIVNHRGLSAGGVRAKPDNCIKFDFMLDGVRFRPTIRRPPTTQNLRAARERLAGIRQRIRAGTFFFDQEFPEYRFLGRVIDPSQVRTCNQVFDQIIAHCEARFRRDDRRAMGLPIPGPLNDPPGILRRLAQRLLPQPQSQRLENSSFSVWHWIWHQERGACT